MKEVDARIFDELARSRDPVGEANVRRPFDSELLLRLGGCDAAGERNQSRGEIAFLHSAAGKDINAGIRLHSLRSAIQINLESTMVIGTDQHHGCSRQGG